MSKTIHTVVFKDGASGGNPCPVYQGQAMGKPSVIYAEALVKNGNITGTRVRGEAVLE